MPQNIATTDRIDEMVDAWIKEGRFANRSEAFRAGIFALKEKLEAQYEASKEIYGRRKERAELPFGHIKSNLKTIGFLLRGKVGVNAETSLLATCFNLARMITILGVSSLIEKLTALRIPVMA